MDLNFHYFAVKTIARDAGFGENDAQLIASYSQFIDDYDIWKNYMFLEVPDYAKSLATKYPWGYSFYTVTTGFTSLFDTARLSLPKYQREIVVPFHFIPVRKLKDIPNDAPRSEYRTAPADITGSFLIRHLLDGAKDQYLANPGRYELMRIGMLLHTFADTYAHQNFSGFHGWENFSYLVKVTDNFDHGKDITKDYNPDFYGGIYSVGHANVNHAPDDTFAEFEMSMAENENQSKKESYTLHFSRSNAQVFADAAKQIFRYLYACQGKPEPTEEEWNTLREKLVRGFALHSKEVAELETKWHEICPDYPYHYNIDELWKDNLISTGKQMSAQEVRQMNEGIGAEQKQMDALIYQTATEDFFRYNLIAKEIRDQIIE